jgi:hypothetical protein
MARLVLAVLLSLCVAGMAWGDLGDIIASYAAPATYPLAAARANNSQYLWMYCNSSPYYIWRINADNGTIYGSYSKFTSSTRGLAYSYGGGPGGSYLWIANYSTREVHMCNYADGSTVNSWTCVTENQPYGLAPEATADGGYNPQSIISTDTSPYYTWRYVPTTGSLLGSFSHGGLYAYDCAWDWRNQLVWGGYGSPGVVRGWTTAGSVVASFTVPNTYPYAITYWGEYLFVGCTIPNHYCYKVHCPVLNVNVKPASVGKVKALFK